MYHPDDGKPEFIELYSPGKVYMDLQDLAMEVALKDESPQSPVPLSDHSRIIPPGSFLVVTKNSRKFMDAYHLELNGQWVEVRALGSLNNSEGSVYLTDRNGEILDMAIYVSSTTGRGSVLSVFPAR